MSSTPTTSPDQPAAWLDEGEVSAEWAPPVGAPPRSAGRRAPLVYAAVLLTLALIVGLLYLAGGFGRRTDLLTPVAPGAMIATGPFELSFSEATAQAQLESDGSTRGWEVVVIGQARTTGDVAMHPSTFGDDSVMALQDPATKQTALPSGADIGDRLPGASSDRRSELTPGLPATSYQVRFPLPAGYRPGPIVRLAVADLVFERKYLVSDELAWDNGLRAFGLDLPVRVLPPQP